MTSQFNHAPIMPVPISVSSNFRSTEYLNQLGLQPHIKTDPEIYNYLRSAEVERSSMVPSVARSTSNSKVQRKEPYICNKCGRILSSASSYYVHMKQHSGNKPYHCTECPASFCRKPYLEVHMRSHTGERPFHCEHCSKKFSQKSSLNIHRRIHTGERPYACEICDKKFAVKSYVDSHRSEKPLSCEECNLPFNSRAQYLLHIKTHSSYSFQCVCGRTFSKATHLTRHEIKVHGLTSFELHSTYNPTFHHLYNGNADINEIEKKHDFRSIDNIPQGRISAAENQIMLALTSTSSRVPLSRSAVSTTRSSSLNESTTSSLQNMLTQSRNSVNTHLVHRPLATATSNSQHLIRQNAG